MKLRDVGFLAKGLVRGLVRDCLCQRWDGYSRGPAWYVGLDTRQYADKYGIGNWELFRGYTGDVLYNEMCERGDFWFPTIQDKWYLRRSATLRVSAFFAIHIPAILVSLWGRQALDGEDDFQQAYGDVFAFEVPDYWEVYNTWPGTWYNAWLNRRYA